MNFDGLDYGTNYTFQFLARETPLDLGPLMRVGDWLGSYLATAVVLAVAMAWTPRAWRPRMAGAIVVAFLLGSLLVEGASMAVQRPRPQNAQNILGAQADSSFPSRAVFLAGFAWPTLALALERRLGGKMSRTAVYALAALAVVFVCISELWLSLHYVTDVLAGLSGGLGLALLVRWALATPSPANA
jgi:undecaprenyl-diphosphatase